MLWLQGRLGDLGLLSAAPTGTFGPQTTASVRAYQAKVQIAVSGVVGPQTAAKLAAEKAWQVQVRSGDTLAAIAARVGLTTSQLLAANPAVTNANRIYAGQKLTVPLPPRLTALAGGATSGSATAGSGAAGSQQPATTPTKPAEPSPASAVPASGGKLQIEPNDGSTDVIMGASNSIFLTFDGPLVPGPAAEILEVLEARSITAAFFVTGQDAARWPEIVAQMARDGHYVESAGWTDATGRTPTPVQARTELDGASRAISSITGRAPRWLRPAAGATDAGWVYANEAPAGGLAVLWWHNIGALPDGPATVSRLDRYLVNGAVIRLPLETVTVSYLGQWLDRCAVRAVRLAPLGELTGAPRGW